MIDGISEALRKLERNGGPAQPLQFPVDGSVGVMPGISLRHHTALSMMIAIVRSPGTTMSGSKQDQIQDLVATSVAIADELISRLGPQPEDPQAQQGDDRPG